MKKTSFIAALRDASISLLASIFKRWLKTYKGIFILVTVFLIFTNFTDGPMIIYKSNPNLETLKPGWKGNISVNGRFRNDSIAEKKRFGDAFKWKFSSNPQRKEKKNENYRIPVAPFESLPDGNGVIWLGHSTFIIQINGTRMITDPVFYNIPANKRKTVLPCDPDSLVGIDYLLLSHDHFDHFNKKSIKQVVKNNPDIRIMMPLNTERLLDKKTLKSVHTQEAGWYQEYHTDGDIRIIFLPARHWGRRGGNDFNKTLWGSFMLISGETKIYFAGDSAYDAELYKDIHQLFGDIDICILPIGAYSPEWFMSASHMNPEESVQVFHDLGGSVFIPMHYGTFDLADEPMGEPIKRLLKAAGDTDRPVMVKEPAIGEFIQW